MPFGVFFNKFRKNMLEFVCRVYNINKGHNKELLERCKWQKVRPRGMPIGMKGEKLQMFIEEKLEEQDVMG